MNINTERLCINTNTPIQVYWAEINKNDYWINIPGEKKQRSKWVLFNLRKIYTNNQVIFFKKKHAFCRKMWKNPFVLLLMNKRLVAWYIC